MITLCLICKHEHMVITVFVSDHRLICYFGYMYDRKESVEYGQIMIRTLVQTLYKNIFG